MARGQAERLVPMIEGALGDAGVALSDVDRIGVGTGPGNFTGLRIAVATARGLALALGMPAVGVNAFDAIDSVRDRPGRPMVPAPRGQGYLLDETTGAPYLASETDLRAMEQAAPLLTPAAATIALGIARVAALRDPDGRPAPLYVRAADAAPSRDAPPVLLDDA